MALRQELVLICFLSSVGCLLLDCNNPGQIKHKVFRYSIKNILKEPYFFNTVTLSIIGCNNDTVVTKYMETAVDMDSKRFTNFSMTYYPVWGFYITAINGLEDVNGTYWEIIEHSTGKQYDVGASSYVPQEGDHVAFNYTTYNPPS